MRQSSKFLRPFKGSRTPTEPTPDRPDSYDALSVEAVRARLHGLPPADLAALGEHERTHQNRSAIIDDIDALLGREPWPGYDQLDVDGVRFGLDGATRARMAAVLAYEQAHRNRAGVLLAAQQHR